MSFSTQFNFNKRKLFNAEDIPLSAQFFKFISGGFWPASTDLFWIQSLEMIGAGVYNEFALKRAENFYQLGTDLDPDFYEFYEQGGILFSFYFEKGDAAKALLEKGIRKYESGKTPAGFWTHPVTLYILKASNDAFVLGNWKQAKESFIAASKVKNAPDYLQKMQTWLNKENSEKELARRVLKTLVQNTQDPALKEKYREKLKNYE